MKITPLIAGVSGAFDTEHGRLACVPMPKHGEVLLCLAESMNIPIAQIRLHSEDRYTDAMTVLPDATVLGNEIARRWNEYPMLAERERQCPTMQEAQARALLRLAQECASLLNLSPDSSPADVIAALRNRLNN